MQLYLTKSEREEIQDLEYIVKNIVPGAIMFRLEEAKPERLLTDLITRIMYLRKKRWKLSELRAQSQKNEFKQFINAVQSGLYTEKEIKEIIGVDDTWTKSTTM